MSVRKGQARLKKIASLISADKPLDVHDKEFLVSALIEITKGQDAEVALEVKAKKGERKGEHARKAKFNQELVFGWLATAIAPEEEGGLGLTLKDAVAKVKAEWDHLPSEESLRRYWNNVRKTKGREFDIRTD